MCSTKCLLVRSAPSVQKQLTCACHVALELQRRSEETRELVVMQEKLLALSFVGEPDLRRIQAVTMLRDVFAKSMEENAWRLRRMQHHTNEFLMCDRKTTPLA